jgi:hypothetical protein
MHRSRFVWLFLGLGTLGACDRADPPTMPLPQNQRPLLGKSSDPLTRATYSFRNGTGRTARRLVIQFTGAVYAVPYATAAVREVAGRSLTLRSFTAPPGAEVVVTVIVEGRSARIDSWYWADVDGVMLGTTNRSCSVKQGCASIAPPLGFAVVSPEIDIAPLQEIGYCYYFRTPNAVSISVRQWRSRLGDGVKRMNVILTSSDVGTPGTQSAANCSPGLDGVALGGARRSWAYTAYQPPQELTFPSDDGTGKPVGLVIPPDQPGYLYIHFANLTDAPITSQVQVDAIPYEGGTVVTPANSFVTYNNSISIPSGSTADFETQSCAVPQGAKFFYLSTYAHKQMVQANVRDGSTTLFTATSPYNPGSISWNAPFQTFASGTVTYELVYANPGNRTITTGVSPATDEIGAVLSYYFPATEGRSCFDGQGPF